jgi:hypothetical protein
MVLYYCGYRVSNAIHVPKEITPTALYNHSFMHPEAVY